MSAAIIEMLIIESSRDGVLTQTEIESIYKEAESMGVSKGLVDSLIDDYQSKIKAEAKVKEDNDRQKKEREDNRKYDVFVLIFEKLVRGWICKSKSRVLEKKEFMPELIREAQERKIEIDWLNSWITKLEKSEQEIAGIKHEGLFGKLKNMFK